MASASWAFASVLQLAAMQYDIAPFRNAPPQRWVCSPAFKPAKDSLFHVEREMFFRQTLSNVCRLSLAVISEDLEEVRWVPVRSPFVGNPFDSMNDRMRVRTSGFLEVRDQYASVFFLIVVGPVHQP